jgi:hypothetical protein
MKSTHTLASLVGKYLTITTQLTKSQREVSMSGKVTEIFPALNDDPASLTLANEIMTATIIVDDSLISCSQLKLQSGELSLDAEVIEITALDVRSPGFWPGMAYVELDFHISDPGLFAESFRVEVKDLTGSVASKVLLQPVQAGYIGIAQLAIKVLPCKKNFPTPKISMQISADISDAVLFNQIVSEAGRLNGRDSDWSPSNAGLALLEGCSTLNRSGNFRDYGLALLGVNYPKSERSGWQNAA